MSLIRRAQQEGIRRSTKSKLRRNTGKRAIQDPDIAARITSLLLASPGELCETIVDDPRRLDDLFDGLRHTEAKIKYGTVKLLRRLSEQRPAVLYPEIGRIINLLDSQETIVRWGAILILGNLAAVDSEHELDKILVKYLEPITGNVMITAANTIAGAGKIAKARPEPAGRIATAIMRAEHANYATPECRNVVLGHAIKSLDLFFEHLHAQKIVIDFVRRQTTNTRHATRNKALKFLRKHASR